MPKVGPKRRSLILAMPCFAALPVLAQQPGVWEGWKTRYLATEGRITDDGNGGISHSEGQAYGLLLAQAFGDRDVFERIEAWTEATLAVRQDALMAWKWQDGQVTALQNATDGDLLRAWALLRAERDSGWSGHAEKAAQISQDLVNRCLAIDPRAPDERLLKPASGSRATAASVTVNPSYYMIRALIELGEATQQKELLRVAAHGERLLADPQALRDWISVTTEGLEPAEGLPQGFGWDALRIPLYLFWSGRRSHPALGLAQSRFAAATAAGHVATVTDAAGALREQSNADGFLAVANLAAGKPPAQSGLGQGYYADTLALLAQIAWREGI